MKRSKIKDRGERRNLNEKKSSVKKNNRKSKMKNMNFQKEVNLRDYHGYSEI